MFCSAYCHQIYLVTEQTDTHGSKNKCASRNDTGDAGIVRKFVVTTVNLSMSKISAHQSCAVHLYTCGPIWVKHWTFTLSWTNLITVTVSLNTTATLWVSLWIMNSPHLKYTIYTQYHFEQFCIWQSAYCVYISHSLHIIRFQVFLKIPDYNLSKLGQEYQNM